MRLGEGHLREPAERSWSRSGQLHLTYMEANGLRQSKDVEGVIQWVMRSTVSGTKANGYSAV